LTLHTHSPLRETLFCQSCWLSTVRVALFYSTSIGESLRPGSRGFLESEPRGTHPRLKIADVPPCPVSPETNWGVWILTLHLNYVAGCTCREKWTFSSGSLLCRGSVATRRVCKNLQLGRPFGEGTGCKGDNTSQNKSGGT